MRISSFRSPGLRAAAALCLLSAAVGAQNYVRGFGRAVFDTSLLDATDFSSVSAQWNCTLAIRSGKIVGWGQSNLATPPETTVAAIKVAPGYDDYAVALLADGNVIAWGPSNYAGQLDVPALPSGVVYTDCAFAWNTGIALRSDGTVALWGSGQTLTTAPSLPSGVVLTEVAAGQNFFLALRSDGEIAAWGSNNVNQLNVPALPAGTTYTAIDATDLNCVALRSDGEIVTWGWPPWAMNVPALPPGMTYTQCSAGRTGSLAIRSDGAVVGWGSNSYGQLNVPSLPPGVTAVQVDAGWNHSAMLRSDGRVVSWGSSYAIEDNFAATAGRIVAQIAGDAPGAAVLFDDGTYASAGYLSYSQLPGGGQVYAAIRAAEYRLAALRPNGTVAVAPGEPLLPSLPTGISYIDVQISPSGLLGLRSDGLTEVTGQTPQLPSPPPGQGYVAIASGPLQAGILTNGDVVATPGIPFPPTSGGVRVRQISTGNDHGLSLRIDGQIDAWGNMLYATTPAVPAPPLPAGTTYVEIAAGAHHSVARRSDGTIVAWPNRNAAPLARTGEVVPPTTGIPSTTYNAIGAGNGETVAIVGPTSTFVTFAAGCAGSLPSTRIVPEDTPKIGKDLVVHLFDLPTGLAILTAGLSNTSSPFGPLPVSAAPLGAPSCSIEISPDVSFVVGTPGSTAPAEHTLAIPNDVLLIGATFYEQALVFDPGANAAGFVFSDAVACVVGR